jgi:hypothetical protein
VTAYFDRRPDHPTPDDLKDHFADLVKSHSWSTVKLDRCGIQFFYRHESANIGLVQPLACLWFDDSHNLSLFVIPGLQPETSNTPRKNHGLWLSLGFNSTSLTSTCAPQARSRS